MRFYAYICGWNVSVIKVDGNGGRLGWVLGAAGHAWFHAVYGVFCGGSVNYQSCIFADMRLWHNGYDLG